MRYVYKPQIYVNIDTGETINREEVKKNDGNLERVRVLKEYKETPWGITNVYVTIIMRETKNKQLTLNF